MDRRVDRVRVGGALVVVALLGAMVFAVVDARAGRDDGTDTDPVERLVEAWSTTRTATYRARGTFERTAGDGRRFAADVEIVQHAPDRLVRQFGAVSGRRDDRVLSCPAPVGGAAVACTLGPPGPSFAERVDGEVAAFRALVDGPDPLYVVAPRGADCWRMTRTRPDPRSGFGGRADVCVDRATGAVRSIDIDHGEIDERTRYDDISDIVTADDLEP